MSFYTSLSGLQAAQTDMSTISHNLANVSTAGFKKSRTDFADVIASSLSTDPRKLVGSGVVVKATTQQFKDGNRTTTSNALDLAMVGDGFFVTKPNGSSASTAYTRNGSFSVDTNNNVVDAQGNSLMVFPVDSNGNVTASGQDGLTRLVLPQTSGSAKATGSVATPVQLSSTAEIKNKTFSRSDTSTYNNSVATQIYDSSGNPMTMTNYYVRTAAADDTATPPTTGTWSVHTFVGDQEIKTKGAATAGPVTVAFDSRGAIATPTAAIEFEPFVPAAGGAAQALSLDLGKSTQLSSPFSVSNKTQDGLAVGQLRGVTVDENGVIQASFSNDDTVALGKVALAKFSTPTGLRQMGNSYWSATGVSGSAQLGSANSNGFGALMSGTIEGSNVDITEELVNLIAAQRNFQANAKALDTASQISQTIFNIRS